MTTSGVYSPAGSTATGWRGRGAGAWGRSSPARGGSGRLGGASRCGGTRLGASVRGAAGAWSVLRVGVAAWFVGGVALRVVFRVAHCGEEADCPLPRPETGRMAAAWAAHQVETTVDFARRSRLVSWFVGGLNFQIEHHLF